MKKWFLIALGTLLLLLCSFKTNQGDTAMNDLDVVGTKEISVTFVNGVEDADKIYPIFLKYMERKILHLK